MRIVIEGPNRKDFDFEKAAKVWLGKKVEGLFSNAPTDKKAKDNVRMEGDARETRTDSWLNENTTFKLL